MADTFSLFILKVKPDSLKSAETFLKNRNWQIGSGSSLRETLGFLLKRKPDIVMIAADHPNKKVKILPQLLKQAFPVKIIVYCESQSGPAIGAVNEMANEYNLFPPVSGPSIERIVLKMQRDEEKRKKERAEGKLSGLDDRGLPSENGVLIKGGDEDGADTKSSFEQARAALSQLISEDAEASGVHVSKGEAEPRGAAYLGSLANPNAEKSSADYGSVYAPSSQTPAPNQGGVFIPSPSGDQTGPDTEDAMRPTESFAEWEERTRKAKEFKARNTNPTPESSDESYGDFDSPRLKNKGNNSPSQSGQKEDAPSSENGNSSQRKSNTSAPATAGSESVEKNRSGSPVDKTDRPEAGGPVESSRRGPNVPIMESDPIARQAHAQPNYDSGPGRRFDMESIIVKGTQAALDDSVLVRHDVKELHTVGTVSNCACIIVESERFSGYLVAALGKDRKMDAAFTTLIRTRLFAFLRAHGEVVKDEDSLSIKIEQVEFESWALEQADFLKKSIHDGQEIAMAFFPTKETNVKLEESVSEKMLKMDISELKEDIAVEFDLYIYMPENNKYLLYTPQGKPIYGTQKNRLTERGITHMHLRKDSTQGVKKYRAQNFLNEKILAFKSRPVT